MGAREAFLQERERERGMCIYIYIPWRWRLARKASWVGKWEKESESSRHREREGILGERNTERIPHENSFKPGFAISRVGRAHGSMPPPKWLVQPS